MTNNTKKTSKKHIRLMIRFYLMVMMAVFVSLGVFAQEEAAKGKKSAAAVIEEVMEEIGMDGARAKFFLLKTKNVPLDDALFVPAKDKNS